MSAIDDNGDPYFANGATAVPGSTYFYQIDRDEAAKMARFQPSDNGEPWWTGLVKYGVSKAIDNTFPNEPRGIGGNTHPGSFGGTNGRSYQQNGAQNRAPETVGGIVQGVAGMSPLMLGLGALALFFAFKA